MDEKELIKKYGPLSKEFSTLYKLLEKLLEKVKDGDFKSDIEAFHWIDEQRKKAGYPYKPHERARMIHVAEQADARRKERNKNE